MVVGMQGQELSRWVVVVALGVAACGYPRPQQQQTQGDATGNDTSGSGADSGPCSASDPNCGTPGDPVVITCTGCPTFPAPGMGAACSGTAAQVVYPPDQVLLPPNLGTIGVQFVPRTGDAYFEIDFENAMTDVRIQTTCNAVTNNRGAATGGCSFAVDAAAWPYLTARNKGGAPVEVTVRGTPTDATCVSSSASRAISFATQDVTGGVYFWQSVAQSGVLGTTGGIYGKAFGSADVVADPVIVPGAQNKCVGCHFVSRDGLKMTFGDDDADSDDEYGDQRAYVYDLQSRTAGTQQIESGFQVFEGTGHDYLFASDGTGVSSTAVMQQYNGNTSGPATAASFSGVTGLSTLRATHPEVSRDGTKIYFTAAAPITNVTSSGGTYSRKDDLHVANGSIWSGTLGAGASGATISNPVQILMPTSSNDSFYYPSISADGTTLACDRATGNTLATNDSYNNPDAVLYAMAVGAGQPIALAKANLAGVAVTNSWPRWSSSVQTYQGKRIAWLVFSSTRDYGLRVLNQGAQYFNCYPEGSPEDPSGDHKKPFDPNCTQPQLWMAAVSLDDIANNTDGSYPAFWVPFQDDTTHNHTPQWVDVYHAPTGCQLAGASCATAACCGGETCDATSMTCMSVIP